MASAAPASTSPLLARLSTGVALAGSVITIVLTVWNAQTKQQIDQREAQLKVQTAALDAELRQRSTNIEESKERVDRYKWVYGLVPDLSATDAAKRNAALAMVRLALTKAEAEGLLAGLQQSPNEQVREAAQQGVATIAAIENAELAKLVNQMNADTADERKRAAARLLRDYDDSTVAIGLVLRRLGANEIDSLSPSGLVNALYFLGRTDSYAWSQDAIRQAKEVFPQLRARKIGPQTQSALAGAEEVARRAEKQP